MISPILTPALNQGNSTTEVNNCCHKNKSRFDFIMNLAEKITAIALGVFSLYLSWQIFIPFFFAGICIGIYGYMQDDKTNACGQPGPSCAQGLLERLTRVKLPRPISIAADIAVTACHIAHHKIVYVPIIAVTLGSWMGENSGYYIFSREKKVKAIA